MSCYENFNSKLTFVLAVFISFGSFAQSFLRSELTTPLTTPWEITYGADNYLWITENGGRVSRVDPVSGNKTVVYTAPDYFSGSSIEQSPNCGQPNIGFGTLGLALHPDFLVSATSYIYYVYSYNSSTTLTPSTKFKIVRLKWDATTQSVTSAINLVTDLPNGYDHQGGRLIAVKQNSVSYLYFSAGDNGISEDNGPSCYVPQSTNPNNFTFDMNYKNGKIHRFNIDGSIPFDNPVAGNSIFTRGHRNPQGLVFNSSQNIVYNIEHGDRTDDEINILESGKNYGWKKVRGYHSDNNYPGESLFISSYTIDAGINGDGLKEALFSWCNVAQPTTTVYLDWCTVAPSDGIYYASNAIPGWNNSILVTTLKNGSNTDMEVYVFKLNADGLSLVPSTTLNPNPTKFFSSDQALNGRLRDIAVSPDGTKIYLINNGGASSEKITIYTYDPTGINENSVFKDMKVYPNPTHDIIYIENAPDISYLKIEDLSGRELILNKTGLEKIDLSPLVPGLYILKAYSKENLYTTKRIFKY